MSNHLTKIVALQRAMGDLAHAERQLANVPDWMSELHDQHQARLDEIAGFERAAEEATLARRRAERDSEEAEARLKHFQEQVSQVRTQREYSALLQEIDTVKSEIKALEEQALSAIEAYDAAQQELDAQREAFAELDASYQEALAKWELEKPAVGQLADSLRAEITELRGAIPAGPLAQFDRIHDRHGGEATAPVRRAEGGSGLWHCTACHYRVRLQVVAEIRRGVLRQCDACKRLLFVEDDAESG